jgi:hypothetical protein
MVPNFILDDPDMCARDKLVLCLLTRKSYQKRTFEVSQAQIARSSGYTRDTVGTAMRSLHALGRITRHSAVNGKRKQVTLNFEPAGDLANQSSGSKMTKGSKYAGTCLTVRQVPDEPVVTINKEKEKKKRELVREGTRTAQDLSRS